ncbi:MAG: hypothetical protein RL213_1546 [Bacteroidota bacterium]|jgi:hypothetical protein
MPSEKELHIVSFDIPFPPNYGGVIDVFFKLKALQAEGARIRLHCFESSRPRSSELERYCSSVHYYKRDKRSSLLFSGKPFIVLSRRSDELRRRLLQDRLPVLVEGLHCTAMMDDDVLRDRTCILRAHNVEHDYYNGLAAVERRLLKRTYLRMEAAKLRKYEPVVRKSTAIAAISPDDTQYFSNTYGKTFYLPAFHPFDEVRIGRETEDFAFYHGNLSIGENNEAACFLVREVFSDPGIPLVIAGSNPSAELRRLVSSRPNVALLDGLTQEEIHRHIAVARVNVLPTFQSTGIKLKLLASLFTGRHCLVNGPMVRNTGLEGLCLQADSPSQFRERLKEIFAGLPFTDEDIQRRKSVLEDRFSNAKNARLLLDRM